MSAQEKKVVVFAERDPNANGSVKGVPEPMEKTESTAPAPIVIGKTLIREGGKIFPSEFVRSAIESKNSDLLVEALDANYDDLQKHTRQIKTDRDAALKAFKKSNTTHYEFSQLLELKGVLKLEHQASLHKIEVDKLKTDQAAEKQQAYDDRKKAWEEANAAKIVALQQAEFKDEPEVDA